MKNNILLKLFYIFLMLQPLIDLITSIMTKFLNCSLTLGLVIRGIIFVFSIIYIIFLSKSRYRKVSVLYLFILLLYIIGYFFTKSDILVNKTFLYMEFTYLFKYFYFIISFIFLLNFFDEFKPNNRKIFKLLEIAFITYCFIIVLANITGTAFGTYEFGSGNTGWFYSGNEIGIILSLLFSLLFLIINKYDSFKVLLLIIPCIIAVEIIGTKTSMIGLLIPTAFFFLYYLFRIKKGKWKQYVITVIMLFLIGISYSKIPLSANLKNGINKFESRQLSSTSNSYGVKIKKPNYSKNIFVSIILSDRDYYYQQMKFIYDDAKMSDKLFGVGFVNRDVINDERIEKLIEMDFCDIYFRYGLIGFIIYILPLCLFMYFAIKGILRNKFKLNLKHLILCYISFIGLFIASIVGHTVSAPAVSFYLALFMIMTLYYLKNKYYKINIIDNKISILALHLGTGGIEKYISSLVKMLHKDYNIEIIVTYKISEKPAFELPDDVKITYLINDYPKKKLFKEYLKQKKLLKVITLLCNFSKLLILKYYKNIRIVEEINSKFIITTRAFHNKIVSNNKNREIIAIATEHNYHNNNNKYVKELVNSCKNINYLVLVSDDLKKYYENKLKNTKTIYIPNVIDYIPNFQNKKNINNKLVSIGRLSEEKGYNDLIDIIYIIKNKISNIKLDIYGDGILFDEIKDKIKKLNLENNINLKGFCSQDIIFNSLKNYDLYVMTSFTESFGLVLLEAMSNSLPCIAFDSANGAKSLLSNGNGILIKNRDKTLFAKEVIKLLNDRSLLNNTSKKGYNSVKKYDIDIIKKKWIDLLSKN